MSFWQPALLCAVGVAAIAFAAAIVVGDIEATGQPPSGERFPSRSPVVTAGDAIERSTAKPELRSRFAAETPAAALREIASLAETPGQSAAAALAGEALSDPRAAVREEAVHALGERGGTVASLTIQQALHDPSARVRDAALCALIALPDDGAVSSLGSALSAADPRMRVSVIDALGERGGAEATRYLEQMTYDDDAAVREAATAWFAELSGG
ncbi:MAG: HEAT repeat domain-containing protein [Steroidobacteraceae bacterium]